MRICGGSAHSSRTRKGRERTSLSVTSAYEFGTAGDNATMLLPLGRDLLVEGSMPGAQADRCCAFQRGLSEREAQHSAETLKVSAFGYLYAT
jgi:hypothetical protein